MADRNASEDNRDVALGEVLRALGAELAAATPDALGLDSATVELDVAVEAGPDGAPVFRVPTGSGGKRRRTARLAVTLRSPEPADPAAPTAAEPTTALRPVRLDDETPPPPAAAPDRAPGLLDLLAVTLRSLSEPVSRPTPGRSPSRPPREDEDPRS